MGRVLKQVCIVLLCCTVLLSGGCRKSEADLKEPSVQLSRKETGYISEYKEIPFEYGSIMKAEAFHEKVFLVGSITEEVSGETKQVLYQYNLLTNEWDQLPVPLNAEKSVQQIKCDSGYI